MKIAVVHNLGTGGARRALHAHLTGLRARGHQLRLFAPRASEQYEPLAMLCDDATLYGDAADGSPLSSVGGDAGRVRQLARQVLGRALYDQARDVVWAGKQRQAAQAMEALYEAIAGDVLASGSDLVYVHQCQQLLVPAPLFRRLASQVPVMFYLQDTLRRAQEWPAQSEAKYDDTRSGLLGRRELGRVVSPALGRLRSEERERYERGLRTLARAKRTRLLVNSFFSRESVLRTSGVEGMVCYLGIDANFWSPPSPGEPRTAEVLSVGAVRPEKRHDRIIEAMAAIPSARRPPLRIVGYPMQAGDDPYAAHLRSLAERGEVRLILESKVSDEALRAAYQRAAVAVFAPYLEPFGLVPLEAMACGAAVVATAEGGLRETVREGVGVLTEGTAQALGGAVDTLLQSPERRAKLGAAGRAWAETWTWEKSLDALEMHLNAVRGVAA